ncbi:MAG: DUF4331 family protein [Anaerolineaceae bacterium]
MRLRKLSIVLAASAIGVAALGAIPALGADHKDAPLTKAAAQSDINDLYIFKGESAAGYTAIITVNPLTSPADTGSLQLDPNTVYELKADTNGDAVPDVSYKLTVSGNGPIQDVTVRRATGPDAITNGIAGEVIMQGKTSAGAGVTTITDSTGRKLYVGPRDDPFFFDLAGFQAGLKFTGVDTFKGTNVTAIVFEVPSVPTQQLGFWATTSKKDNLGNWVQLDRMARPAINTVFVPAEMKDAFNNNTPDRDLAIYKNTFIASLKSLGAGPDLASVLLPDILTVDLSKPVKYLNGRAPADDVIDISLQAITGNATIGDGVNANDRPFSATFPYLAAPNTASGAPGAPNTGSSLTSEDGNGVSWTLPAALIVAASLMAAAALVQRRRIGDEV